MSRFIKNEPCEEGYALGFNLAKWVNNAREKVGERCFTCAFRQGTEANGSVNTTMTALKCVMEGEPFYCHEVEDGHSRLCSGYATLRAESDKKLTMPWDYPAVPTEEERAVALQNISAALKGKE